MSIAIGAPQYGSRKKLNFRLQDGENVYRILPPLGELAAEGVWSVYDCIHWGYKGSRGARPFKCIQRKDFKTKMIRVQCPECDKIAEQKALLDSTMAQKKAEGATDEVIKEFVKPLSDWLFSHNLDKKWYLNVLTPDGKVGRLAIPHKMYTQLQEVIAELVEKKHVDPIGVSGGVWFNFIRTGKGTQTSHRVSYVEETVMADVGGKKIAVSSIKPAPLTEDVISRLSNEAHDLKNSSRTLTFDEIQRIVFSGGDPEVVDGIYSTGEISSAPATTHEADEPDAGTVATMSRPSANVMAAPQVAAPVPQQASPAPAPVASTPVAPTVPVVDPMVAQKAALEAEVKALQEKMAKLQGGTSAAKSAPSPAHLDDDTFIKQFGFKS